MNLKYLIGMAAIFAFPVTLFSYIEMIDRMYDRFSNKTIDFVSDQHKNERRLSNRDMRTKSFRYIEQRLCPSKKRFMQALRTINDQVPGTCDVIWEYGLERDYESTFIGHAPRLVGQQFQYMNFIKSDISRDAFEQLLFRNRRRTVGATYKGVSFNNPMPLPDERIARIIAHAGDRAWKEYEKLHKRTCARLRAYFGPEYLSGRRFYSGDLEELDQFDALADIEMLSHILASDKPHVIVYAGGWHINNMINFLERRLGYKLVSTKDRNGRELSARAFDLIDRGYKPVNVARAG